MDNAVYQVVVRAGEEFITSLCIQAKSPEGAIARAMLRKPIVDAVREWGADNALVRRTLRRYPRVGPVEYAPIQRNAEGKIETSLETLPYKDITHYEVTRGGLNDLVARVSNSAMFWLLLMKEVYSDWDDMSVIYGMPIAGPRTYRLLCQVMQAIDQDTVVPCASRIEMFPSCREGVISTDLTAVFYPNEVQEIEDKGLDTADFVLTDEDVYDRMRVADIDKRS